MHLQANIVTSLRIDLENAVGPLKPIFSDSSPKEAAAFALCESFHKKLLPSGSSALPDDRALVKFKDVNSRIAALPAAFAAESEVEAVFYDYFRNALQKALTFEVEGTNLDFMWFKDHIAPGPGAAQLANSSWFYTKMFQSTMSYTDPYLIPYYRALVSGTGSWDVAERQRFKRFGFEQVDGGKLFFAKKNAEISRTCCTEAALNVLFQKAIGDFIEDRLRKHFGISLESQPSVNVALARQGSIDGSFGTIDLVSASDSIPLKRILDWLGHSAVSAWVLRTRSNVAVLPDGSKLELSMVSTMGNGFTFPLQTIIFSSVVRAVYQLMDIPERGPTTGAQGFNFSVFGDDIIVRKDAYEFVCRMLEKLGFEVNVGKSFNNGPFRESCGSDFFRGVNIRGVYVKSYWGPQQVCSVLNRLTSWSARHEIALPNTCQLLLSLGPFLKVPPSAAVDSGLWVPFRATTPVVSNRYWFKYRFYKTKQRAIRLPDVDECWNPYGLCATILNGHTMRPAPSADYAERLERFAVPRSRIGEVAHYKIARAEIPWWDFVSNDKAHFTPLGRHPLDRVSYSRWEAAVAANRIC